MTLITSLFLVLAASVCASGTGSAAEAKLVEGRGIWINAGSIPTDDLAMAALIDRLAAANLNILFPEVIRRGYTIYPSRLDEQDPKWKGYDPLAALVREARARGMEVHPWVWVFRQGYTQDQGPIFRAHPEWMAVNKWGETLSANGGLWVCPSIPEARDYLVSLVKELAENYNIDGLHLDYIRFEAQFPAPYCYNASCREQFKAKYGMDPMDVDPLGQMQVNWHLWRENLVNTFVERVSTEVRRLKPRVKISAAVGSFPDQARERLLQNWPHWVDNKWLDFVTPMAYTANSETFQQMVTSEKAAVDERTMLMPGLGLHTHRSLEPTEEQIGMARRLDTDGITIFAAVYMSDEVGKALAAGPFANRVQIPFRDTPGRVKTLLDAAIAVYQTKAAEASQHLRYAARLLGYMAYQAADVGYVPPTRPPILIPETVLPLAAAEVTRVETLPTIDGRPDEPTWATAARLQILHKETGGPAPVQTEVLLGYDDANLYIACIAREPAMAGLKATVTKRDGPTFYDDSVELFLDPSGRRREYYQLAANTLGTQFDAKVNNSGVNLDWQAAAMRTADGWTAEVCIPFVSLGAATPSPGDTWAANFARNRWVTGKPEYLIWSVPYGSFHMPERFGSLTFR